MFVFVILSVACPWVFYCCLMLIACDVYLVGVVLGLVFVLAEWR